MDPDDLESLQGCLGGGAGAREGFVRHFTPLVSWAVRRTAAGRGQSLDPARIEDLRQEVFLALFEHDARRLRRYDPAQGKPASWIARIAHQVTLRKLAGSAPQGAPLSAAGDLPDPAPHPPERESLHEEVLRVREALRTLPPREKLCLALLLDEELPAEKAAALLRVSRQRIYRIRDRALQRLKAALR